jgi:hypothetical protein
VVAVVSKLGQSDSLGQKPTQRPGGVRSAPTSILLQNSKVATVGISGENLKREEIDDSYSVSPATEVAYEFSVRRRGPSGLYTKPRLRPSEFLTPSAKRLLQHYLLNNGQEANRPSDVMEFGRFGIHWLDLRISIPRAGGSNPSERASKIKDLSDGWSYWFCAGETLGKLLQAP